jgi:TPR repeat protein
MNLGYKYDRGEGVAQDFLKAMSLYIQACEGGDTMGCYNLGHMYVKGEGVKEDSSEAFKYFTKACMGGDVDSCRAIGIMKEESIDEVSPEVIFEEYNTYVKLDKASELIDFQNKIVTVNNNL